MVVFSAFFACAVTYYGAALLASHGVALSRLLFPLLAVSAVPFAFFLAAGYPAGRRSALAHTAAAAIGLFAGFAAAASMPAAMRPGLPPEKISAVSGTLVEDPRLTTTSRRGIGSIRLDHGYGGGVKVSSDGVVSFLVDGEHYARLNSFGRGCRVYAEGSFSAGRAGGSSGPLFIADSLHVTAAAPAAERLRTAIRLRVAKVFAAKGEWGGLALALILGIKDNLDTNLSALYRDAGCSHVLALSGMHLAVVSAIVAFLLKKPLGYRAAAVAGLVFVTAYVFLIGGVPSLRRAAIMYALGTLAVLAYLPRDPLVILALSFMLQIGVDPGSGVSASFLLSYLALWGILSLGTRFASIFDGIVPGLLLSPLSASIGAFAATSAVSVLFFGALRPAGIAAGLVVVPVSTVFMIGAILSLVISLVFPAAAAPLDFVLNLLYRLLAALVEWAGRLPGLVFEEQGAMAAVPVLVFSLCFAAAVVMIEKKYSARRNRVASFA